MLGREQWWWEAGTSPVVETGWRRWLPRLLACMLALAIMGAIVQASLRWGRLAHPPIWDDVGALSDGAVLVRAMYQDGLAGVAASWAKTPPHQPYVALLAFAGFMLFGIKEWGPYVLCVGHVLGFLMMAAWVLRTMPWWVRGLGVLLVGCVPLVQQSVEELKPDFAAGLVLTIATLFALGKPLFRARGRCLIFGMLMGAVAMGKPSVFVQTFLVAGMILTIALVTDVLCGEGDLDGLRRRGGRMSVNRVIGGGLGTLLGMLIVFGPHLACDWRHLWNYMAENAFGKSKGLWTPNVGVMEHATWYLVHDGGGARMLGPMLYICGGLAVLGLACVLLMPSVFARSERVRAFGLVVAVIGLFAVPTVNPVKNHLLGLGFQCLLVYASLLGVVVIARAARAASGRSDEMQAARRGAVIGGAVLACAAMTGVGTLRVVVGEPWAERVHTSDPQLGQKQRDASVVRVYEKIAEIARRRANVARRDKRLEPDGTTPTRVLLCNGMAVVNNGLLNIWSIRDGVHLENRAPWADRWEGDFKRLHRKPFLGWADVVICGETGNDHAVEWRPLSQVQNEVMEIVRSDERFVEVWSTPSGARGKKIYVFERIEGRGTGGRARESGSQAE